MAKILVLFFDRHNTWQRVINVNTSELVRGSNETDFNLVTKENLNSV